ncbi:MAG: DUF3311 domain-containing protein [Pirellulaceae bacterium]|nr:DUF3311 domain-containing protein [Pirellulaceae bacterium]
MNPFNKWVWLAIAGLLLLHHDFWFWENDYLVGGFMPIGLAYHVVYSMVVTVTWVILTFKFWPQDLIQE